MVRILPLNQEVSGSILIRRQDFFFFLFSEALSLFVGFIVTFTNSTVFPTMNSAMNTLVVDHLWTTTILTINIGKNILFIKSGSQKQLEKLSLLDNIFPHSAPPPQKKTHHLYVKVVPTSNSLLTFSSSSFSQSLWLVEWGEKKQQFLLGTNFCD